MYGYLICWLYSQRDNYVRIRMCFSVKQETVSQTSQAKRIDMPIDLISHLLYIRDVSEKNVIFLIFCKLERN